MPLTATVDRIEDNDIAVLEIGDQMLDVPLTCLPVGTEAGDKVVVRFSAAEQQ